MNVVLLFETDFVGTDRVALGDVRARHIREVIRPALGDTVTVGLVDGRLGEAQVLGLGPQVELAVTLDTPPPPPLPVTLLLALPRPKSLFRLLQLATTFGVKDIHLFNTSRVEKSFWKSRQLHQDAMRPHLLAGLEQARDTVLPRVTLHRLFAPLVNDTLPELVAGKACYLAHPGASPAPHGLARPTALAVGPERGFIPYEVRRLEDVGFVTIGLGDRILRTEQALPALLGAMFL